MTALVNSSGKFSDIYWIKKILSVHTTQQQTNWDSDITQKFSDKKEDCKPKKIPNPRTFWSFSQKKKPKSFWHHF